MSCEKNGKNSITYDNHMNVYKDKLLKKFEENSNPIERLIDFPKYVPNNALKQFLVRYELIKLIENVPGDIIECGVCGGRGILSLLQCHLILEPNYYYRKVIGFDTFCGFVKLSKNDNDEVNNLGDFIYEDYNEILDLGKIHTEFMYKDLNKLELIKGDAEETIPEFIEKNKHTLVSLLYLDFDLYLPTKKALECFLPRMCKGSVIAFDEIHFQRFPGETLALLECLNINKSSLKNLLHSNVNYIVL